MATVGVLGVVTADHLIDSTTGESHFDLPGGPALYATLGAVAIHGTRVDLRALHPRGDPRVAERLQNLPVDLQGLRESQRPLRVWVLRDRDSRRVVSTDAPGLEAAETAAPDVVLDAELAGLFGSVRTGADHWSAALACSPPPQLPVLLGMPVGIDPDQGSLTRDGAAYWTAIAAAATLLLPSRTHLSTVDPDPVWAALELARSTGRPIVARIDADGVLLVRDRRVTRYFDPLARPVETTGAGDAMAGALMAALARGSELGEAVALAVSVARIAISGVGTDPLERAAGSVVAPYPEIETQTMTVREHR